VQSFILIASIMVLVHAISPTRLLAASVPYGFFTGDAVTFGDVTESSLKPVPLYGPPSTIAPPAPVFPCASATPCTITGNSLHFSPQLFVATSNNQVPPSDETDGQLTFSIQSKPGQTIKNIDFSEGGGLSVGGFAASNTDDTYVDVSAVGFVTVTEIDGVAVNPVPIPIALTFDFGVGGDGTWRFKSEGPVNGFLWNGGQFKDIKQDLINLGQTVVNGATKATVNLDNILFAQSEPLGQAQIDKKLFLIITVNTPEPASIVMALIGLLGATLLVRRSR
jgi:hypothetical protein